jgi:micrococcal nuclease
MKKFVGIVMILAILLVICLRIQSDLFNIIKQHNQPELWRVTRVVDGDTVELSNNEIVRYIGMDTPEIKDNSCFGNEAKIKNKELVEGQLVRLEKDVSDRDRYGRWLRYVWLKDTLINEELVRFGFAKVATYPPDVKYVDRLLAAQRKAREEVSGLWSKCQ